MQKASQNLHAEGGVVSLGDEHEVRTWARSLGCSERELREAVTAAGDSKEKVRKYLAKRRWARRMGQLPRHA